MKARSITAGLAVLLASAGVAWAAQEAATPSWRPIWDATWRVINFLILAYFLYKVGKEPLKKFLADQRETIAGEIEQMERAKAAAAEELKALEAKMAGLEDDLKALEERLAARAERERAELMDAAKKEAEAIVERAKRLAELAISEARRKLVQEMMDLAAEIAARTIREKLTPADQARLVEEFASQLSASARPQT